MTLKELMAKDLDVFFNLNDFAEMIEIDGVKLPAIVDSNTGNKYEKAFNANKNINSQIRANLHSMNLIGDFITVQFKTSDYTRERGRIPQNLEFVRINSKRYKVENSQDLEGITRLDCYADRDRSPRLPLVGLPPLYEE